MKSVLHSCAYCIDCLHDQDSDVNTDDSGRAFRVVCGERESGDGRP